MSGHSDDSFTQCSSVLLCLAASRRRDPVLSCPEVCANWEATGENDVHVVVSSLTNTAMIVSDKSSTAAAT